MIWTLQKRMPIDYGVKGKIDSVKMTVVDQLSMQPHAVEVLGFGYGIEQEALEKAFTMFKTAKFDYLYNWEYIKAPQSQGAVATQPAAAAEAIIPDQAPNNTKVKFEPAKVK